MCKFLCHCVGHFSEQYKLFGTSEWRCNLLMVTSNVELVGHPALLVGFLFVCCNSYLNLCHLEI